MNKLTFRRFDKSNNRFVYQDTFSWRGYYDSHIGGKWCYDRNDRIDAFLGDWELFTGKFDKHGTPIYVGDIVKQVVKAFDPFKHYTDVYIYKILWDEEIQGIRCPDYGDDEEFVFLSDIEWDECEIIGNIHQNEECAG